MTTHPGPGAPEVPGSDEPTPPFGIPAQSGSSAAPAGTIPAGTPPPALTSSTPSSSPSPSPSPGDGPRPMTTLIVIGVAGLAVAVALGVYGRVHQPTFVAVNLAGFSGPGYAKAWLATLAALLGVVQVLSSAMMYGKLGGNAPPWIGTVHRWSGRAAVLITIPVLIHCLYALGFQYDSPRVLVHSLLGCLFYGIFVTKMLALTRRGLPGWVLPVTGGVLFTALVGLWLTSSLWLFSTKGLSF